MIANGTRGLLALGRDETLRAMALAAVPAALLILLAPTGGDAAAHLYRTLLVREGVYVWDNLWFAGQYPLASYSLLYYLPAAVVGNIPLVFCAVLVSAALFASISIREWGAAALWPARAFSLLAAGPLFTGTYSYALGLAAMLAALRALQAGRAWLGVVFAALTLGFSPLAFIFLCLVLLAVLIARRRVDVSLLAVGGGLAVLVATQVASFWLFPSEGEYPFRTFELVTVLTVSALGAFLAVRARGGSVLAALFALWGVASLVVFFVPEPVGENLTRMRAFVFPVMLLTALLARFRPRALAVAALAAALAYNVVPYAKALPERTSRPAGEEFWAPALAFLRTHATPDFRVEVVPTYDHWEAYWLPRAGFALARGWYRQLDIAQNAVLYKKPLSAPSYRDWLKRMGVKYVLLPETRLGKKGADWEAQLLRSRRLGLTEVFSSPDWRIFEVPRATKILTGPGVAQLSVFEHRRIAGTATARGTYRLRVSYMPYWEVRRGAVCVGRAQDGMTQLHVYRPGPFTLALDQGPTDLVRSALGSGADCTPADRK
jgi:hypothetical protein